MARHPFHGTRQVLRLNWPFYTIALSVLSGAVAALRARKFPPPIERGTRLGLTAGAWWIGASLVAAWWIFDVSALCRWHWLRAYFPENPRTWATFHASLDDATPALRELFDSDGAAYDFYDARAMTDPSIHRARLVAPPEIAPIHVDFRDLKIESDSLDAAFMMLSAHELRKRSDRARFFAELERVLKPGGTLVAAEQVRNVAQFAAFGPGASHFFAASEWRELGAMFETVDEFSITPWVRIWVWRRP